VIDPTIEQLISFRQAAEELPRRRQGRKIAVQTFYRWSTTGCRGTILETIQVGGSRCTSREALARFFQALTVASATPSGRPSAPHASDRTPAQRRREDAAATRRAKALGC
jgi:hypothetical protein